MTSIASTNQESAHQKTTLPNGLRVVTSEMSHTRSVSISMFVGVGSRYESDYHAGVSHFIEHLLFKGTANRPTPQEISSTIERTGGVINAGTEQELTVYWCKIANPYFRESLDLMMDMLRNSLFDPDGLERERMVVIEELAMIWDYPGYKVEAMIDDMLWPKHPLGRDIGGTKESVMGITRDMVLEHMQRYYNPANIVISVAGNVAHEEVVDQVEELSRDWPSPDIDKWEPYTGVQSVPESRLEYKKTEQVHLSIAVPGVPLNHPDRYPTDMLSVVLGEGMSSRLFVEVRERRGLAYDVHSGVAHFLDTGAFVINAGVDPSRIYDAVATILEQLSDVKSGIPEEELDKAKHLSTGRLQLRMEDTRAVSSWMGSQELLTGHIFDIDHVIDEVHAVTLEDLTRVANCLLVTEKLNMAVVGPCRGHKRLEKLLRV